MHAAGAWERVPGYPGERESLTAAGYMCIPACARRLSGVHKYIYRLTEHSSTSHRIACHHLSHPGLLFLLTAVTYIYTCPRVCVCALAHFISSGRNSFIQAFRLHSTPHRPSL